MTRDEIAKGHKLRLWVRAHRAEIDADMKVRCPPVCLLLLDDAERFAFLQVASQRLRKLALRDGMLI